MDLLRNAYSATTDEDEENKKYAPPPLKRAKAEFPHSSSRNFPTDRLKNTSTEAPIAGRYISKRERALMAATPQTPNVDLPTSSGCFHVQGSISDLYIRKDILSLLRNRTEGYTNSGYKSERMTTTLIGHSKAVNALEWSKTQWFFHRWKERVFLLEGHVCKKLDFLHKGNFP